MKYRVHIPTITNNVAPRMNITNSQTKEGALRNVIFKIIREIQNPTSPYNKNWEFKDGRFKVKLTSRYAPLMYEYLVANPHLYKVEELR